MPWEKIKKSWNSQQNRESLQVCNRLVWFEDFSDISYGYVYPTIKQCLPPIPMATSFAILEQPIVSFSVLLLWVKLGEHVALWFALTWPQPSSNGWRNRKTQNLFKVCKTRSAVQQICCKSAGRHLLRLPCQAKTNSIISYISQWGFQFQFTISCKKQKKANYKQHETAKNYLRWTNIRIFLKILIHKSK